MRALTLLSLALLPAPAVGAATVESRQKKSLRPNDAPARPVEDMVQPLHFDQKLLICNAYPSNSPVVVKKNGNEDLADGSNPISFRECRYISNSVQQHDKLDLSLRDVETHGTFEVGELPATDAVLLLVLEKREGSSLVGFQSFAFPSRTDDKDAQLAVIDTFKGNSSNPHLKMEDHILGKEAQTVSKRIEQLNFNRVYSVEEGNYDASIGDKSRNPSADAEKELELSTRRSMHLNRGQNYVILRTGGSTPDFPESLVVYPESQIPHSGSTRFATAGLAVAVAAVMALMG